MKLLYVWIERYRNIERQGFIVDDEFVIKIVNHDAKHEYVDSKGNRIYGVDATDLYNTHLKIHISINKNNQYACQNPENVIQSISVFVGENAVGKTNILSCFAQREEQGILHDNQAEVFFAFYDKKNERILIRARRLWLSGDGIQFINSNSQEDFLLFELRYNNSKPLVKECDITHVINIGTGRRFSESYIYVNYGLPCINDSLSLFSLPKRIFKAYEYMCHANIGKGKMLVLRIKSQDDRNSQPYFSSPHYTDEEKKQYFLRKLCQSVLHAIREYLFQDRDKANELFDEYMRCGEVLAFSNCLFPSWDSLSLIKDVFNSHILHHLDKALDFLRSCTYMYTIQQVYLSFLQIFREFVAILNDLPAITFTAFYKLELPFDTSYFPFVKVLQNIIEQSIWQPKCIDDIHFEIEWLSAGEEQQLTMFTSLYQVLSQNRFDGFQNRHIILLMDEPEMHMHPEMSRMFMNNLTTVLSNFYHEQYFESCQLVIATHSPFIVQKVLPLCSHLFLVSKEIGNVKIHDLVGMELDFDSGTIPSYNLIMFFVFGIPTIELHDELYGYIERKVGNPTSFASQSGITFETRRWIREKKDKTTETKKVSLSEYIRHSIHHPENQYNIDYTENDFVNSLKWLIQVKHIIDGRKLAENIKEGNL